MKNKNIIKILRDVYFNAAKKEKATTIHLFGIKYAEEIKEYGPLKDLVKAASISYTYQTEIRKGMNLSKYVELKDNAPI